MTGTACGAGGSCGRKRLRERRGRASTNCVIVAMDGMAVLMNEAANPLKRVIDPVNRVVDPENR